MYFINNYYDWEKGNNTINQRLISKTDASHWSFSSDLLNSWLVLFFWNIFKLCCTNAKKSFRSFCSVEKCANLHLLLDHLYHNQNHNQTWHRESFGWKKCFRRIHGVRSGEYVGCDVITVTFFDFRIASKAWMYIMEYHKEDERA